MALSKKFSDEPALITLRGLWFFFRAFFIWLQCFILLHVVLFVISGLLAELAAGRL